MADNDQTNIPADDGRRHFLKSASTGAMLGGLTAGYGTFACYAGRFLFPAHGDRQAWQFVTTVDGLQVGESLPFTTVAGAKIVVARQGNGTTANDFIALSSVCPHLGCQVHWEEVNNRFFCPCHNGAFDARGVATSGPPAAAGQELARFPLKVENGMLFLLMPLESLTNPATPGDTA